MTSVKKLIKKAMQRAIRSTHARLMNRGLPRKVGLLFHSLEPSFYPAFRTMVRFFREANYRFVSPEAFLQDASCPCVLVTFDDSYRTWFDALPLLDALGVQATFYVNTCFFREQTSPEEIERYYDALGFHGTRVPLSTAELRALAAAGHTIGAHTHSHPRLTTLAFAKAQKEIRRSKSDLEALLGSEVKHFAYPFGMRRHFSEPLRAYCRTLGFETVAQAIPGMQHVWQRPYRLNRSTWNLGASLRDNVEGVCIDGRFFERLTGRSAVG